MHSLFYTSILFYQTKGNNVQFIDIFFLKSNKQPKSIEYIEFYKKEILQIIKFAYY